MKEFTFDEQNQPPNFMSKGGKLYVVRCHSCKRENYALAVASGCCAWCGWDQDEQEEEKK